MPEQLLNLQLFGEEGAPADTGEVANPTGEIAGEVETTEPADMQTTTAPDEETFESLIKGKYKDDFSKSVDSIIKKRFRNQKDLQGQINAIDPMIRMLAQRYEVQADANGNIPIELLSQKVFDDNSMYEQEAFQRGISVDDLKQIKSLERENAMLRANQVASEEQAEWDMLVEQGNHLKEMYPSFDMDMEMQNPMFGRLLATMQKSGFPNPVQTAYEAVHREEIMGGAMQYAVQQTQSKISKSIQSGMSRPNENGNSNQAAGTSPNPDPSTFTKEQIENIKKRALNGEKIDFINNY